MVDDAQICCVGSLAALSVVGVEEFPLEGEAPLNIRGPCRCILDPALQVFGPEFSLPRSCRPYIEFGDRRCHQVVDRESAFSALVETNVCVINFFQ